MFAYETQILRRLAVLVVCHDLAVGQINPTYFLIQRPMTWSKAQKFCRRHYAHLAVLSTEEQYFTLLNATAANSSSFWLGLQRQNATSGWQWVNEEELSYDRWYRKNYECRCASLEAMLKKDKKLLARYCNELHMFVCQGPDSLQSMTVDSVDSDHLILSWNVSAFLQMTPHSYNVTTCTNICDTLFYPYTAGSVSMTINISNLTPATAYFIEISAFVVRPDSITGGNMTLQSNPTALQVRTDTGGQFKVSVILKLLKLLSLAPPLWILYRILKKSEFKDTDRDNAPVELLAEDTTIHLIRERTRGIG